MWYLEKNVYLVYGHMKAAFYDFNRSRLIHVSKDAKELLSRVLKIETQLTQAELEYLESLKSLRLLTDDFVPPHEILELKEKPVIDFAWIEITNFCNLKCLHCYNEAESLCGSIMRYDDFCHVIDELVSFGVKKIQIIGGEPFALGEKIIKYLDYLEGKFDYVEIFTNGTLLNDKLINYIKTHGIKIALSVYSYNAAEHDRVTQQNGSWDKTNENIKKLRENNIKYVVKNVLMKNVAIGDKNTELYELSSVKDVVRLTGRASLSLLSRELARKRLITKKTFSRRLNKVFVKRCLSGHNCFSRRLYFSTDLNVYPCVMERRIAHGNLKNFHLKDILDEKIFSMNKNKIQECRKCEFRYCCFDCRPDSNGKELDAKPWYCTYSPFLGEWNDGEKILDSIGI
ncbi:MAG: radical SAM protein [Synergistaceae bacterium]|nr:radical SAM protein [Synergistaceae bacterium]